MLPVARRQLKDDTHTLKDDASLLLCSGKKNRNFV